MELYRTGGLYCCADCTVELKKLRGCPDLGGNPDLQYEFDGNTYNHCLVRIVTSESHQWIMAYNYSQVGIMPEAGGLNDQWEIDLIALSIVATGIGESKV